MLTMKTLTQLVKSTLISLATFNSNPAQALINTVGCNSDFNPTCSLQELFDGGSIIINETSFSQWQLLSIDTTAQTPDFSEINVIPLDTNSDYVTLRYEFNDQLSFTAPDFLDLQFGYDLMTLNDSSTIQNSSLDLADFSFVPNSGGAIDVVGELFDADGITIGGQSVFFDNFFNDNELSDSIQIQPQSQITSETLIFITTDTDDDLVILNHLEQGFFVEQAPVEPLAIPDPTSTISILMFGLFGLVVVHQQSKS